jgi:polysaccharide transporter, PST family
MTLIKTSILSAIASVIKMINGFVIIKIIAIYVGPSGLAFIGQFQNFVSILMSFATGAINGGVVKYTAENYGNEEEKQRLWSTALKISLGTTFFVSLMLIVLHNYFSNLFFKTDEYGSIFLIFALTLIFFVLNSLLLAILNSQKEIKKLVTVNIVSSFVGLILIASLAYKFGLYGALLSFATGQALVFFVTLGFVVRSQWFKMKFFTANLDKGYLKKLAKYTAMAITAALTMPISQMIVRNYIGESVSWDDAGYWDGIWKISTTYLMLITTTLSIYYLPRLSEIKNNLELRKEILYGYKIILPIAISMAITIYFLRYFIILTLFTEKFMPMTDLFLYQLIGDVFKIASWLLSYLMVAKAMTKTFIITEILTSLSFILLSMIFINLYGLLGVTIAFALNYSIYFILMLFIFRNIIKGSDK